MEDLAQRLEEVAAHILAREVEDVLVAPYAGPPVGDGDHPIGMILVELALDADHLRLDPEAEHHAEAVDLLAEAGEAGGELLGVDRPVTEGGVVVIAEAEPAVIEDEELNPELGALPRQSEELLLGELEVGRLPVVDEDRALAELPRAAHDVVVDEVVEVGARPVHAGGGVGEDGLRALEAVLGRELPAEGRRVDARDDTCLAEGGALDHLPVVGGVDEVDADALLPLVGQEDAGVVVRRAHPALGVVDDDAGRDGARMHVPLARPGAVEGGEVPLSGEVELETRDIVDAHRLDRVVVERHAPGYDVALLKDGVGEAEAQRQDLVAQHHLDGGALALLPVGLGKAAEHPRLARHHPGRLVDEVQRLHPPPVLDVERALPHLALASTRVLGAEVGQKEGGVVAVVGDRAADGLAPLLGERVDADVRVVELAPVVEVFEVAGLGDGEEVGGALGREVE